MIAAICQQSFSSRRWLNPPDFINAIFDDHCAELKNTCVKTPASSTVSSSSKRCNQCPNHSRMQQLLQEGLNLLTWQLGNERSSEVICQLYNCGKAKNEPSPKTPFLWDIGRFVTLDDTESRNADEQHSSSSLQQCKVDPGTLTKWDKALKAGFCSHSWWNWWNCLFSVAKVAQTIHVLLVHSLFFVAWTPKFACNKKQPCFFPNGSTQFSSHLIRQNLRTVDGAICDVAAVGVLAMRCSVPCQAIKMFASPIIFNLSLTSRYYVYIYVYIYIDICIYINPLWMI